MPKRSKNDMWLHLKLGQSFKGKIDGFFPYRRKVSVIGKAGKKEKVEQEAMALQFVDGHIIPCNGYEIKEIITQNLPLFKSKADVEVSLIGVTNIGQGRKLNNWEIKIDGKILQWIRSFNNLSNKDEKVMSFFSKTPI